MGDFKNLVIGLSPRDYEQSFPFTVQSGNISIMSSTASKIEWRFQADKSGVVNQIGIRLGAINGTPPTHRIGIQNINSSGYADGSYSTFGNFTPTTQWANQFVWIPVLEASLTVGGYYSIVLEYYGGTVNIWNCISVVLDWGGTNFVHFPGTVAGVGSALTNYMPAFGLKFTDGTVIGRPIASSTNYMAGGDVLYPAEVAMAINFPSTLGSYYKLAGIMWIGQSPSGSSSDKYTITLYDDTIIKGQITLSCGQVGQTWYPQWRGNDYVVMFDETRYPTLLTDHTYYIGIRCLSAAMSDLHWDYITVPDAEMMDPFPCGSYTWKATRNDVTESWTDHPTQRVLADLIISEWGGAGTPLEGVHLKFTPSWNDNVLIQHADDMIRSNIDIPTTIERHEYPLTPIGNAIESYSGYLTVEIFVNPDTDRTENSLFVPETPIEQVKMISFDPWEEGLYEIVFRLRAKRGSETYREVVRWLRVII